MLTGLVGLGMLRRAVLGREETSEPDDALFGARASMEPALVEVSCQLAADGRSITVEQDAFSRAGHDASHDGLSGSSFGAAQRDGFSVESFFDGEVVEVALVAREALRVTSCLVRLRHAFATDELVLLNGYQSWTDSVERSPWSRMRGLEGVPQAVVERYALSALGDYGFVERPARRGLQHGFTYATFRRGAGMVLVGSLGERGGFTLICTDASAGTVELETECPLREIAAGERVVLGRYAIVRGTENECYDRWFSLANITPRPSKPLVGYSSWYRHYGDIDEDKLLADLKSVTRSILGEARLGRPLRGDPSTPAAAPPALRMTEGTAAAAAAPGGAETAAAAPGGTAAAAAEPDGAEADVDISALLGRATRLFQIDDGYCKVGDWLSVDQAEFPRGLKPLADAIAAEGFLPGLWVAPFVCERDSRLFAECNDWLLRDDAGELVRTGSHWSGGYALDTRNVEVRSYVLDVLQTITKDWGLGLLKVDFLYAACLVPHDGMNRGELMADAMELVRKGAGDALVLGCGVPLASAFGVADFCRIGCDVGLDWDDKPYMRALHRERVSTKRSLANTYGRAPLDGRAFGNDPDVFFLRRDVKLTDAQRDELLFADADLGSVLLTSDDMGAWNASQHERYEQALRIFLGCKEADDEPSGA